MASPMGGGQSLEERKRQLLQWMAQNGATQAGYHGRAGSAVGRMGGIGGQAPLPSLTYNPFFSQIAGRNENFPYMPNGVSSAAAAAAQAGGVGPGMGLAPGTGTGVDAAPGIVQPHGGNAGRNLIGAQMTPALPPALQPGALAGITSGGTAGQSPYVPYDPYARLTGIGNRGIFRE